MTRPERSATLGYASNALDRLAEHRDDADRMAALSGDPAARSFLLSGDIPVLRRSGNGFDPLWTLDEASGFGLVRERAFLGLDGTRPLFGTLVDAPEPETDQGRDDVVRIDLRSIAVQALLPPEQLGPLAEAKSLMFWHQRHRFCAACGARTQTTAAGWRRECASCGTQHFPRTDPVAIMLAARGDLCLLGRQSRFPPGMYSCLAGFVEPGETLEDAVRRELKEEAGIATGRVTYLASQPWPFPSSLMIGCLAEATSEQLVVDHVELEDARWFPREEVRRILAGSHPDGLQCPPTIAIANSLMRAWAVEGLDP
jgi:NAD+ diphosphatase